MRCPLALYRNAGSEPIDLRIGEAPGDPPFVYQAEPGDAVEGPANYERVFVSAGFQMEKLLGDGELKAPQANHLAAPRVAAPATKAPEEPAVGPGVVISAPMPATPEEPPRPTKKARGG